MKNQLDQTLQSFISSETLKNQVKIMVDQISKDRLGQWAFESDSEIAGTISGLQRMRIARFNKVSGK